MPATDRNLIELAAKAAGMLGEPHDWHHGILRLQRPTGAIFWNPLEDDGDGARLEAALGIELIWHRKAVHACIHDETGAPLLGGFIELYAAHNGDKQAARRRATVRCAAAMAAPTSAGG